MNKISTELRDEILSAAANGESIQAIVRTTGVAKNTVCRLMGYNRDQPKKDFLDADPNPTGLCMCGCGQRTTICLYDNRTAGMRAGYHYKYVHSHASCFRQKGRDKYGYTQYERTQRNNAIWRFIHDLLPTRPMKREEIFSLVLPRWPEKSTSSVGRIITFAGVDSFVIPKPILIKPCAWCGQAMTNRRCRWCSRECEQAEKRERAHQRIISRTPVMQPISLLCRDFHATEHDCLAHMAFDIVRTETDAYNPDLVASAWLGIRAAWDAGERNKPDLIVAAQAEIKKFYRHDRVSYLSIDAMKEAFDYEPIAHIDEQDV